MKPIIIPSKIRKLINRLLFALSILFVIFSSFGIQIVLRQIRGDEHDKVKIWASSVQQKSLLVVQSQEFFEQIEAMERSRVQFWADAFTGFVSLHTSDEFEFYRRTMEANTTIPVIVVQNNEVFDCANTTFDCSNIRYLEEIPDSVFQDFLVYKPVRNSFMDGEYVDFYYKQSEAFSQLKKMFDELINSFITEIVENSASVPVLLVTKDQNEVIQAGNILPERYADSVVLKQTLRHMGQQNQPIVISAGSDTYLVFYERSDILKRLSYIPTIFFGIIAAFVLSLIWVMGTARHLENEKLWIGMSRETAHQLGTPLTSLIGWLEYLRSQNVDENNLLEIEKDLDRLKVITERFSKIGSEPKLTRQNVVTVVYDSISYLQFRRLSRKIKFQVNVPPDTEILVNINSQLLEWVFENLSTNAANAIGTNDGLIQIDIVEHHNIVVIDITDNGKGIPRNQWRTVFETGYTTRYRGWGIGLALIRRIIHDYHKGKIFIKQSVVGEGTTFRIIFNK